MHVQNKYSWIKDEYKGETVGPYAMDSGQAFYLIIKRFLDIILGLIGLILLVPGTILIKAAYLISGDAAPIFSGSS